MSLTKTDLKQIKELINESRDELLTIMFKYFPTKEETASKSDLEVLRCELKEDLNHLKDDVSTIRMELDTEHEFRLQLIEKNRAEIVRIKEHIKLK
ncbi:MAG: hypothetical protein PHS44_05720 [Candidatus Dojkabacteria bacterium]|jgi:hypothetical protein|nr:hypothetical protein [Candidatus Dojkabacteria bacterium]